MGRNDRELKQRLRLAFERASLTQQDLASEVGVTQPAVSGWLSRNSSSLPDDEKLEKVAKALDVTVAYLEGEEEAPRRTASDATGEANWLFDELPPNGARDFGNAAMYAFNPTIATLVKEGLQNIGDVPLPGLNAEARFRVINLTGKALADFQDALHWDDNLLAHLKASTENHQKIGTLIRSGLERDKSMILLALDDFNTTGMIGEDFEETDEANNFFVALARDTLNSTKFSSSAGGSFGLGKAVFTRMSSFATVLFSSNLSQPTKTGRQYHRLFGRSDLAYHQIGKDKFAGRGWFGVPGANPLAIESCWGHAELLHRLHLDRGDRMGTSILVVGFVDSSSDQFGSTLKDIAAKIEEAAVQFFWPAITSGRLTVTVETYEGHTCTGSHVVNPKAVIPEAIDMLDRGRAGQVSEKLVADGDIVSFAVPLHIPRRRGKGGGNKHADVDHDCRLLIRKCSPETDKAILNQMAVFRAKEMVIRYVDYNRVVRFAVPFTAALMCGEAADSSEAARFAEEFLRTAEPPQHDNWLLTPDLKELYYAGGGKAITDMFEAARDKVRDAVKMEFETDEEGPRALADMLRFGSPPKVTKSPSVMGVTSDAEGRLEVTLRIPLHDAGWSARPIVLCKTETGSDLKLDALDLEAISGVKVHGDKLLIDGKVREATFRLSPQWTSKAIDSPQMSESIKRNAVLTVDLRDLKDRKNEGA